MTKVQVDLDGEEDRRVETYKAENRLGSKEEAVKAIIRDFKPVTKEKELYDAIGKWFLKEKGCQDDDFSKGFVEDISLPGSWKERPDIVAVSYEVSDNVVPAIDFHGYVVEVKMDEKSINEAIGKTLRYMERCKSDWNGGFADVAFYIAYVKSGLVEQAVSDVCRNNGVGLLQLDLYDGRVSGIREVTPQTSIKRIPLQGISHSQQSSPGNFERGIRDSYLSAMLKDPENIYNRLIRPKKSVYEETRRLETVVDTVREPKAKNALDFVLDRLEKAGHTRVVASDRIVFELRQGRMEIRPLRQYFYIDTDWDGRAYRVRSTDDILEGPKNGELARSSRGLDEIIRAAK